MSGLMTYILTIHNDDIERVETLNVGIIKILRTRNVKMTTMPFVEVGGRLFRGYDPGVFFAACLPGVTHPLTMFEEMVKVPWSRPEDIILQCKGDNWASWGLYLEDSIFANYGEEFQCDACGGTGDHFDDKKKDWGGNGLRCKNCSGLGVVRERLPRT